MRLTQTQFTYWLVRGLDNRENWRRGRLWTSCSTNNKNIIFFYCGQKERNTPQVIIVLLRINLVCIILTILWMLICRTPRNNIASRLSGLANWPFSFWGVWRAYYNGGLQDIFRSFDRKGSRNFIADFMNSYKPEVVINYIQVQEIYRNLMPNFCRCHW